MSIYLGDTELTSMPLGDVVGEKIYLGDLLVLGGGAPPEEFDRHVVYNVSNIAEEFRAPFSQGYILNGTFDIGIQDWENYNVVSFEWFENSKMLITVSGDQYIKAWLSQTIPVTEYVVKYEIRNSTCGIPKQLIYCVMNTTLRGNASITYADLGNGNYDVETIITPSHEFNAILIQIGTASGTAEIDNVSILENVT